MSLPRAPMPIPDSANRNEARGAAYWALRQVEGPALSPPEQAELSASLAADPALGREILAMRSILADDALTNAMKRSAIRTAPCRQPTRRVWLRGGLAAALALSIGAPFLLDRLNGGQGGGPARLTVPPGSRQTLALADGSLLTLNGRTEVLAAMDMPTRQLTLVRGEAHVQMAAAKPDTPFTITCGNACIRAQSGALNLDVSDDLIEISLHAGVALLTVGDRDLSLHGGQRVGVAGVAVSGPMPFDPQAGDFRTGWLVTQGLSLAQLAERLNRTAPLPVRITDPAIARRRVAGRFKVTEPERLLASLGRLHGFTVLQRDGALELKAA